LLVTFTDNEFLTIAAVVIEAIRTILLSGGQMLQSAAGSPVIVGGVLLMLMPVTPAG
jgi:hypothetical protein